MTNREWLNTMSDSELLNMFGLAEDSDFPCCPPDRGCYYARCSACWADWLKAEHDGGDKNE